MRNGDWFLLGQRALWTPHGHWHTERDTPRDETQTQPSSLLTPQGAEPWAVAQISRAHIHECLHTDIYSHPHTHIGRHTHKYTPYAGKQTQTKICRFTLIHICTSTNKGGQSQFCTSHKPLHKHIHRHTHACVHKYRWDTKLSWLTSDDHIFGVPEFIQFLPAGSGLKSTDIHAQRYQSCLPKGPATVHTVHTLEARGNNYIQ